MRLSFYRALKDTTPEPAVLAFDQLAAWLGGGEYPSKEAAPLWSPAEIAAGGKRCNEHVVAVHCGVVDVDDAPFADVHRVLRASLDGVRHLSYTTWQHAEAVARRRVRGRWVIELTRPVLPAEWPEFWRRLVAMCGLGGKNADRSCKDPSRAYYVPAGPPGHPPHVVSSPGRPLDVDSLLRTDWTRLSSPRCTNATLIARAERHEARSSAALRETGRRLRQLVAGEVYARPGERDDWTFKLLCDVFRAAGGALDEEVVRLFEPSLAKMSKDGTDPITVAHVREKIARCRAAADEDRTEDGDARKRWAECLRRSGRDAPYSSEEASALAAGLGIGLADLDAAWVLQREGSYYVLRADDRGAPEYVGPLSSASLPERAEVVLAPADPHGVVCQVQRSARLSRKQPADLVADHGSVLDEMARDFAAPGPHLDFARRSLVLPAARLRDLEPVFSPAVDRWLRLLGGDLAERLLDWIATVTDLSRPSTALFVEADPDVGKDLLATILARLWSEGGPCDMEDALPGAWNERLTDCPLVWANENVPTDWRGKPRTEALRRLITDRRRTFRMRWAHATELRGCVRVLITANGADWLRGIGDLTPRHAEAICDRILHVETDPAAADYLRSLGGGGALGAWVEGDEGARHVLWLRDNRHVATGARFAVEGNGRALLRRVATSAGARARVCQWVVTWLLRPGRDQVAQAPWARAEAGRVFVAPRAVYDAWEAFMPTAERLPELSRITSALRGLSVGQAAFEVGGVSVSHFELDFEALADWAADSGYCSPDDLRARALGITASERRTA